MAESDITQSIDSALKTLQSKKLEWTKVPLSKKIQLLKEIRVRLIDKMGSWGKAGADMRGSDAQVDVVMEMFNSTMAPAMYINKLITTLESLQSTGKCPTLPVRDLPNGQKAVQVWPLTASDRNFLLLPGATAELYLQPGAQVEQGRVYTTGAAEHKGAVCAILGAGNHGFLGVKDILYCLFERSEVCAFKPHPIMAEWHSFADYALEPLRREGVYFSLACTTVEATRQLLYHPLVDCVHMTGGTATHDAIVWGPTPEEQQRRKAAKDPLLKVPITSELGCITPCIVAGGEWTQEQLKSHAHHIAMGVAYNNSCNCNAFKVLILPGDWAQADEFLDKVRFALKRYPMPPPYYPGIQDRYASWKAKYPEAEALEGPPQTPTRPLGPALPYLLNELKQLPDCKDFEYAFKVEPFAPVLTVVRLPTKGATTFLNAATQFANKQLWGTLSCTLILHPDIEQQHPQEVQQALIDLKYGITCVNSWSGPSIVTGCSTWGAYAGDQTLEDVGSGIGSVGNAYMVENVQKSVYRVPFEGRAVPKPMYMQPVPLAVGKAIAGFMCNGYLGAGKAVMFAK